MLRTPQLPDPDDRPAADVVIYDGQCRFCRGQVQNLRRLDRTGRLAFLSLHDPRARERWPDLSHDQLMREMWVIDRQGRRHAGADAVRYLSRRLPLLWPVAPLLHLPGTARLWRWMYRQVAKRRYQITARSSDTACDDGTCKTHF